MKSITRTLFLSVVCAWPMATSLHAQVPVTSGLQLWLQADSLVGYTNNQRVLTWTDSSGNGNNGISNTNNSPGFPPFLGATPTYVTNGVGGKPAVHFDSNAEDNPGGDGSGDYFNLSTYRVTLPAGLTYIAVIRSTSTDSTKANGSGINLPDTIVGDIDNLVVNSFGLSNGLPMYTEYTSSGSAGWNSGPPAGTKFVNDNAAHIMDATSVSGAQKVYADGLLQGTSSNPWYSTPGFSRIGGGYGGGDFYYGDVAELLIYNTVLSSSDRFLVDNYLADKYSIGGVPEPSSVLLLGLGGLLAWRLRRS